MKYVKAKDFGKGKVSQLGPKNGSVLLDILQKSKENGRNDSILTKYFIDTPTENVKKLSMHHLILKFFRSQQDSAVTASASDFLQFCSSQMSELICQEAVKETITQDENKLWHKLRYGRITASRAYETAHCHTLNGCLVEKILGAIKMKDSYAMKRGKSLEKEVRQLVEKKTGIKIQPCGFYTSPECPIMGASPDGITEEHILEIKCPNSEKRMTEYLSNGKVTLKYSTQMQLQMYFTKKQKGLFCVTNYDFETSKDFTLVSVEYDELYCNNVIQQCIEFWKRAIFPILENCK